MRVTAVVPAAGRGSRMGAAFPKQYLTLNGKPVLTRTLEALAACAGISEIVVVADRTDSDFRAELVLSPAVLGKLRAVLPGGPERQDSVYIGLQFLQPDPPELVVIHDGVRPLVSPAGIETVIAAAGADGAAVLAVPVKDTIKMADGQKVARTLERRCLWAAQTPQAFAFALLLRAYEQAAQDGFRGTDDASLAERCGINVRLVPGAYDNIKITTPEDLLFAEAILRQRGGM